MIVATEAKMAAEGETDLIERVKKCMKASLNHWMATDENDQFRGAVAGAMLLSNDEEQERLRVSMNEINGMNALFTGIPVDVEQLLSQRGDVEVVPLVKLWQEVRDA